MKIFTWLIVSIVSVTISLLAFLFLREMPSCFTINSATGFAQGLYAAGVTEDAMRRVWHAGWIAAICAPWMAISAFVAARWIWRNTERLNRFPIFATICGVLTLLSLPDPVLTSLPGLDNSWQWILSHFAFSRIFGSETVFTYGPLGFLICPQGSMSVCLVCLLANLVFSILWFIALTQVFKSGREGRLAAWLLLLTMFFPQGSMEWRWVLLAVMSVAIPVFGNKHLVPWKSNALLVVGGLLLSITAVMKFSSLIVVAGSQIMLLIYHAISAKRWRQCICYACGFLLPFVALCVICFSSIESMLSWFKGSVLIASGYNRYMVSPHDIIWIVLPFMVGAIVLAIYPWRRGKWQSPLLLMVIFSPLLFCTAKYGWVRQGPGPFLYAVAGIGAFLAWLESASFKRMLLITIGLLIFSYGLVLPRFFAGNTYCAAPFGVNPLGIVRTCNLPNEFMKANAHSAAALKSYQVPESWWHEIGSDTVMMFPDEYAPVMGRQNVNLVLLPSFQLYSGYLPQLDRMNALRLEGDDAPRHIICRIDVGWRSGRMINYPMAWNAILSNYNCEKVDNGYAWLKRQSRHSMQPLKPQRTIDCKVGEWVDLPADESSAFAIDWAQTTMGKIAMLFCRNTQTYISFRFDDGTTTRDQMVVENLSSPFPISCIPKNDEMMADILHGKREKHVRSIRIEADTQCCYAEHFLLRIFAD